MKMMTATTTTAKANISRKLESKLQQRRLDGLVEGVVPRHEGINEGAERDPDRTPQAHAGVLGHEARQVRGDRQDQPADEQAASRQEQSEEITRHQLPESDGRLGVQPDVVGHPESLPGEEREENPARNDPHEIPRLLDDIIIPGEARRGAGKNVVADVRPGEHQEPRTELILIVARQGYVGRAVIEALDGLKLIIKITRITRFTNYINLTSRPVAIQPELVGNRAHPEAGSTRNTDVGRDLDRMPEPGASGRCSE